MIRFRAFALAFALLAAPVTAEPVVSHASDNVPGKTQMGVNLSGCSFTMNGALCPTPADVDWYADAGFMMVRIPFKGEQAGDPEVVAKIAAAARRARKRGMTVILDRHDYKWPAPEEQVAFWRKLLPQMPEGMWIDPENEPRGFDDPVETNNWMQWARDANAIIAGLRRAGLDNVIVLEWPGWSAMYRFDKHERVTPDYKKPCDSAGCALDRSGGLIDPAGRTLLSPHMYFDKGSSGTNGKCNPSEVFSRFAEQARARHLKALVGEVAFGSHRGVNAACRAVGEAAIAAVYANPDVYRGVTWWGGGRAWKSDYPFAIAPKGHQDKNSAYVRMLTGRANRVDATAAKP